MAKHYVYGSGMSGCLYDNGPNLAETIEEATESLLCVFSELDDKEKEELRVNLRVDGIHYFSNRSFAGADYCDVTPCDCDSPEDHDSI